MNEPKKDDLKIIAFNSYDDFSKYSAKKILDLYEELDGQKAITELAVKGLREIQKDGLLGNFSFVSSITNSTLSEIERLSLSHIKGGGTDERTENG